MRLAQHANKLETNVQVESQNFGIGDASVVIEILRNRLYQHKIRTLVQEYICNARDAHREVDSREKLIVTVPNRLNPIFKVRDFGPGISPDRMRDVFIMYGASTKRGTNKQTGGFGIGAKSAWSYTDSFTIVSITEGKRRTYVAHTGVNNNGRLDLIETVDTDEPNGTEIQVSVKPSDLEEFKNSVLRAIHFWPQKPTLKGLVDAPTDSGLQQGLSLELGKHFELVTGLPWYVSGSNSYSRDLIAVIDGVPYAINRELRERVASLDELATLCRQHMIFHVGNGLIEVSASRESIADSKQTIEALDKLASAAIKEVKAYVKAEFDKVRSVHDFMGTYSRLEKYVTLDASLAEFQGYKIERGAMSNATLEPHYLKETVSPQYRSNSVADGVRRNDKTSKPFALADYGNIYYVDVVESRVIENRRLRTILATARNGFVLIKKHDKSDPKLWNQLITDLNAIPLSSVQMTKAAPVQRVAKAVTEITVHIPRSNNRETATINITSSMHDYVYVETQAGEFLGYRREDLTDLARYLDQHHGVKLVGLAPLTIKKVQGLSNFQSLESFWKAYKPETKDLRIAKRTLSKSFEIMSALSKGPKTRCKFFSKMQLEYADIASFANESTPKIMIKVLEKLDEVKDFVENDSKLQGQIETKYKLLKMFDAYNRFRGDSAEWVEYINAKS
jgi:hypothetical protein